MSILTKLKTMLSKSVCQDCIQQYSVARALIAPEEENVWRELDNRHWEEGGIVCPGRLIPNKYLTFKEAYKLCNRKKEHNKRKNQ